MQAALFALQLFFLKNTIVYFVLLEFVFSIYFNFLLLVWRLQSLDRFIYNIFSSCLFLTKIYEQYQMLNNYIYIKNVLQYDVIMFQILQKSLAISIKSLLFGAKNATKQTKGRRQNKNTEKFQENHSTNKTLSWKLIDGSTKSIHTCTHFQTSWKIEKLSSPQFFIQPMYKLFNS